MTPPITIPPNPFQKAAERAAGEVLAELRDDIMDALDVDDEIAAEAVVNALVRAFFTGAKLAAVEVAAQCIEQGVDVRPNIVLLDPA